MPSQQKTVARVQRKARKVWRSLRVDMPRGYRRGWTGAVGSLGSSSTHEGPGQAGALTVSNAEIEHYVHTCLDVVVLTD